MGAVAELVEREIWSLVPGQVKTVTYKFILVAS